MIDAKDTPPDESVDSAEWRLRQHAQFADK
jgi:hypothetical protein